MTSPRGAPAPLWLHTHGFQSHSAPLSTCRVFLAFPDHSKQSLRHITRSVTALCALQPDSILPYKVTQNQERVFDLQWVDGIVFTQDSVEPLLKNMALRLRRRVDERDEHLEVQAITELSEDRDSLHLLPQASAAQSPRGSPGLKHTESKQRLSAELADAKAKIRRLRQEIEEKKEQLLDCKQALEQLESELRRLQRENKSLLSEARPARVYRDELDILREKAMRADKLESEVSRYKERLHGMEFYKARVEKSAVFIIAPSPRG